MNAPKTNIPNIPGDSACYYYYPHHQYSLLWFPQQR